MVREGTPQAAAPHAPRAGAWRFGGQGRRGQTTSTLAWPMKIGLNWSMPAMVRRTVGSSGTRDELGRTLWPRCSKNSCVSQRTQWSGGSMGRRRKNTLQVGDRAALFLRSPQARTLKRLRMEAPLTSCLVSGVGATWVPAIGEWHAAQNCLHKGNLDGPHCSPAARTIMRAADGRLAGRTSRTGK